MNADRGVFSSIGALLFVAAVLKGMQWATVPVPEAHPIWQAKSVQIATVFSELSLGAMLIFRVYPHLAQPTTLAVFVVFAILSLYQALRSQDSCGCFGALNVNPWIVLALDVCVLLSGGYAWSHAPNGMPFARRCAHRTSTSTSQKVAACAFACVVAVPLAVGIARFQPSVSADELLSASADQNVILLTPSEWRGRGFPLAPYIDRADPLRHGNWIVVLHRHDCSKCEELFSIYEHSAIVTPRDDAKARIAFIELPPYAPASRRAAQNIEYLKLSSARDWFVKTPVELWLSDGVVRHVVKRRDAGIVDMYSLRQATPTREPSIQNQPRG